VSLGLVKVQLDQSQPALEPVVTGRGRLEKAWVLIEVGVCTQGLFCLSD